MAQGCGAVSHEWWYAAAWSASTVVDGEQATELSALRDKMSNRLDEVAAATESIGCDPAKPRKLSLVATDVIKKAALAALAGTPEQEYAMYLWRIGSGPVHGHPYTRYLQLRTGDLTTDADGRL